MSYLSRLKQLACDEKFTDSPRPELTELPEAPFGGFGGTVPGCLEKNTAANSPIVGAGNTVTAPMTADDEKVIRAWLALIEETDPETIGRVLDQCRQDADARAYFTGRAVGELPKPDPDDRRRCTECLNLRQGVCSIAKPEAGALVVASPGYRPFNLPLRCAGYTPKANDTDQRPGAERWPGLQELEQ